MQSPLWKRGLATLLVLVLLAPRWSASDHNRIAVCISGQVGRMLPEYMASGLFLSNRNYQFHLFFNLYHAHVVYTTKHVATDSIYQNMSQSEISLSLRQLFSLPNTRIESVLFSKPGSSSVWQQRTKLDDLGLFDQFRRTGHVLLDMYKHHEDCANQIAQFELQNSLRFSYIISTREDIYFFNPLNISYLVENYMTAGAAGEACQLLTKGCLDFGGLNMRLQLIERGEDDNSLNYLRKVSRFTELSHKKVSRFLNPESFELYLAEQLYHWKTCKIPIEEYPVTACRLSYINRSVCFVHQELKLLIESSPPCVPQSEMDFAIMHLCPRVVTRYQFIPWQSFAFVPNSAFPKAPLRSHHLVSKGFKQVENRRN